jgi:hypothetical protein
VNGDTVTVDELHVESMSEANVGDFIRVGIGDSARLGRIHWWDGDGQRRLWVTRWRDIQNQTVAVQNGPVEVEIVRRLSDVGAIHLTKQCRGCEVAGVYVRGSWSDAFSADGEGNLFRDCEGEEIQDSVFTMRGPNVAVGCVARNCQFLAFNAQTNGNGLYGGARLENCRIEGYRGYVFDDSAAPTRWSISLGLRL